MPVQQFFYLSGSKIIQITFLYDPLCYCFLLSVLNRYGLCPGLPQCGKTAEAKRAEAHAPEVLKTGAQAARKQAHCLYSV